MSSPSTTLFRLTAHRGASSAAVILAGADASQSATDRLRRESWSQPSRMVARFV